MPVRPRFDPKRPLVAARAFLFMGRDYGPGDPFPDPEDADEISDRLRARQYEARAVNFAPDEEPNPVQMKPAEKNGYHEISAPWLDEPEIVRGKVKAEKRLEELRAEGAPLGWIDGGSEVTVEGPNEGGWYAVDAPWLEEAEHVQGREGAEARQRELHDAGEPETHHGVTLTEGENAYWTVEAEWLDEPEKIHGEDAARERAAELREQGAPEPDEGAADDQGQPVTDQADEQQATDTAGDGDPEPPQDDSGDQTDETPSDATEATEGGQNAPEQASEDAKLPPVTATHRGGGYYEVAADWLDEPIRVRGAVNAENERQRVEQAGPPYGWAPADA